MDEILLYRRDRGWGTRNHVLVLPLVASASGVARAIARGTDAIWVGHEYEPTPEDLPQNRERIARTLAGFAANPNVAAALLIADTPERSALLDRIRAAGQRADLVVVTEAGGFRAALEQGRERLTALLSGAAAARRERAPVGALILGTECGGSDALSGITANPALGAASDHLVDAGGTVVLAETTELIGAEHLLARRAASPQVAEEIYAIIHRYEAVVRAHGEDIRGANPAPGNIEGGLTTIEEKSLGAAKKGGTRTIRQVVEYAVRPAAPGLVIMDTPGHDIEQMVGMVAGGAQVAVFTTGRGTPTGSPIVPVIKVATNSHTASRMQDNIDLNAGLILEGTETIESMGRRIYEAILAVAQGETTKAERLGHREFSISRYPFGVLDAAGAAR
ncbi:MAG: altronate dehydratase [Bacillati bacterium ANGP1]|uniref:Altronate dehydratase n=1 Tax=Candidatus Segetimicrobium genomatis TaxID=2569760 RepID=A0A537JQQ3_9BACT|nr:MAG: altronate dehydratase [Terrabacteria group bacterium ANGP1]